MKSIMVILDKLRLSEASTYAGIGLIYTAINMPPEIFADSNKLIAGIAGVLAWIIKEKGSK